MNLKNKKVLLVGLGILGGGLSMAKFLRKEGAALTITDLRDKKTLEPMIRKLEPKTQHPVPRTKNLSPKTQHPVPRTKNLSPKTQHLKPIRYTLGKHLKSDFDKADIIIFNPAVPSDSEWVKYAKKHKKPYFNDYTFFLHYLETKKSRPLTIGVTGTRGKTTTSLWINHLIPGSVLGGNIPEKNLLKIMTQKTDSFVLELSSFQLEYLGPKDPAPSIAILTNVYIDHLNRYKTLKKYRDIKFKIFRNQTEKDALILNLDEPVTKLALAEKPKAKLFFVSLKPLPKNKNGLFFKGNKIYYQFDNKVTLATRSTGLAPHEKSNLLVSMMVAHLAGTTGKEINKLIRTLPEAKFRLQTVFKNKDYLIVNDSAGTNPDATIAAIEKYKKNKNFILITGGTNKELDFKNLAKKIITDLKPENLFLLEGSGTDLLVTELKKLRFLPHEYETYENLTDIVDVVSQTTTKGTILFSPACASFEKFKNEFDRGEAFNRLVKKYF